MADLKLSGCNVDIEIPEATSTSAQMGKSEVTALGWYDKSFFCTPKNNSIVGGMCQL